jgi:AAA+ superfamily predicted ATPase
MVAIQMVGAGGESLGRLPHSAEDVIAEAEQHARDHNLAKRKCFPKVLRQHVEAAGYAVEDSDLAEGVARLEAVRAGQQPSSIEIRVCAGAGAAGPAAGRPGQQMPSKRTESSASRFFEAERNYPNPEARAWYDRLIGLDEQKRQLLLELELLLCPARLADWSRKHHGKELRACRIMANRAPLILLEGDVGCGKTALAETVGDPLAERLGLPVTLLKVNTQVRGTGLVGEMTDLIVQAFTQAEARADELKGAPVLLLIDEADALAAKRADQHMHHEDKAGLNTLLQRVDSLRLGGRRIAVIFITNRPDALDPAVRRRAALDLSFGRPDDAVRAEILRQSLPELELPPEQLRELVTLTGATAKKKYGATFTASDLTDRLLPAAVRDAYAAGRALVAADLIKYAREMEPTPPMEQNGRDDA